jgi:transposase-like protein
MSGKKRDAEKARYWERTIREAACSGVSIQEFCRQRKLQKSQFYWWRRRLEENRQRRTMRMQAVSGERASFALVSDDQRIADAGIELVLGDGRRLRISKGVDEATLRAVLAAMGPEGC